MIVGMLIGATILIAGFSAGFLFGRIHRETPKVDKYADYRNEKGLLTPKRQVNNGRD